ncbi:hypothetical protein P3S67_006080 [Capsicum chacoense]
MDLWHKARSFAEEAAKRSQDFTISTQELTIGTSKLSDVVSEASKQIVAEASKRAEQIKFQIPSAVAFSSILDSSSSSQTALAAPTPADLEKYGVTDELREFVKGFTKNTFQNFQLQDESEMSNIPTVSNIRQDLTEFQEKHAKLVLSSVKEISKLRYEICPRIMRERKFWKIYFIIVNNHLAPYEKKYTGEISAEKANVEEAKDISSAGSTSKSVIGATTQTNKKTASSTADQDLDVFLLGEDSDEGPDDEESAFDDDFDKI